MSINENNIPFFGDLGLPLQAGFEFRKAYKEHAYPLYLMIKFLLIIGTTTHYMEGLIDLEMQYSCRNLV